MEISIDLKGLEQLNSIEPRIREAAEKALDRGAKVLVDAQTRAIGRTYARAIPKGKKGKPKWPRSGDLMAGVGKVISEDGQRTVTISGNASKPITNYPGGYAEKLTTLPVSKDGVNRQNNFPQKAVDETVPQLQRVIESELKNELRKFL